MLTRRDSTDRGDRINMNWLAIGVAVAVSVFALILMRETPWPYDPMFYMDNAEFFSGSRPSLALEHRSLRWGLMLPLGLLHIVFGYTEISYYAIPVVAIALLSISVFLLSRRLMGPWWSATAAVLAAANPLVLSRSSHPFPDTLATALVTLGIAAIAWMDDEDRSVNQWLAGAAGVLFGLSYAVREVVAPVFVPVILALLLLLRIRVKHWLLIAGGGLSVLAIELALMQHWFDDPMARLRILLNRDDRTVEESASDLEKIRRINAFQGTLRLSATAIFRKWGEVGLGFAPVLGLIGLATAWGRSSVRRVRRLWLGLAAWLVIGWIAFVFFGLWRSSDAVPVLNLTQIRYWYLLVPPVAIGVIGLLNAGSNFVGQRWKSVFAVGGAVVCLVMVLASWDRGKQVVAGNDHMGEFRSWVMEEDLGSAVIVARHRSMRIADMYDNTTMGGQLWDGKVAQLNTAEHPTALMISSEDARSGVFRLDGTEYSTSAPPVDWDLQFVSSDGMLVILAVEDLDALPDDPKPVSGPDFPVAPEPGKYALWRPAEPTGGPYRYRVSFSGETPLVRCGWENDTGGRSSAPALSVDESVLEHELRHVDFYCPARQKDSWIAVRVVGPNPMLHGIVVVNDAIVEPTR